MKPRTRKARWRVVVGGATYACHFDPRIGAQGSVVVRRLRARKAFEIPAEEMVNRVVEQPCLSL